MAKIVDQTRRRVLDGEKASEKIVSLFEPHTDIKRRGIEREDMPPSPRQHGMLKRFRAGVEAGISCLKRCFGLGHRLWSGLPRFKARVQSAVLAHNLLRFARLRSKPA